MTAIFLFNGWETTTFGAPHHCAAGERGVPQSSPRKYQETHGRIPAAERPSCKCVYSMETQDKTTTTRTSKTTRWNIKQTDKKVTFKDSAERKWTLLITSLEYFSYVFTVNLVAAWSEIYYIENLPYGTFMITVRTNHSAVYIHCNHFIITERKNPQQHVSCHCGWMTDLTSHELPKDADRLPLCHDRDTNMGWQAMLISIPAIAMGSGSRLPTVSQRRIPGRDPPWHGCDGKITAGRWRHHLSSGAA